MVWSLILSAFDKRNNSDSSSVNVSEQKHRSHYISQVVLGLVKILFMETPTKLLLRFHSFVSLSLSVVLFDYVSFFAYLFIYIFLFTHFVSQTHTYLFSHNLPIHFAANPPFVLWCQTRVQKRPGRQPLRSSFSVTRDMYVPGNQLPAGCAWHPHLRVYTNTEKLLQWVWLLRSGLKGSGCLGNANNGDVGRLGDLSLKSIGNGWLVHLGGIGEEGSGH